MSDISITGFESGLGKYLFGNFEGATGIGRGNSIPVSDVIINCAFDKGNDTNAIESNLFLLNDSIKKGKKIIHISSVDIYKREDVISEEGKLEITSNYAYTKIIQEELIERGASNFLILRCSSMLGWSIKKNNLIKLLKDEPLSLSQESTFNFINHKQILDFIRIALTQDIQGCYNLVSNNSISFKEIAGLYNKVAKWGSYTYNVGNISNKKVKSITNIFDNTSEHILDNFVKTPQYV